MLKTIYTITGSISFLCLCFTLYVFIITKQYKPVRGKIILANIITTILVNIWFVFVINIRWIIDVLKLDIDINHSIEELKQEHGAFFYDHVGGDTWLCILGGYYGYLTILIMFAWMTVMCVDLFWTFFKSGHEGYRNYRLVYYCLIGFGIPLIMTILAVIFQVILLHIHLFNCNHILLSFSFLEYSVMTLT